MSEFLTAKEIAELSGLDVGHVRRLLGQNKFPNAAKRGGAWFVPRDDFDSWLSKRKAKKKK